MRSARLKYVIDEIDNIRMDLIDEVNEYTENGDVKRRRCVQLTALHVIKAYVDLIGAHDELEEMEGME